VSTSAVSFSQASILESTLEAALAPSNNHTTATTPIVPTTLSPNTGGTSDNDATNPLVQDMVALLKALASGDTSGAKNDLAKLKEDLKAQQTADASGSNITKDVTSLLRDLTSGNISAAKSDVIKLQADLKPEDTPTSLSAQNASPLNSLVSQISDSLSSGSVQGALQGLAAYLVQNGQSTGSLVDTTA
jgi:hypothetical protein